MSTMQFNVKVQILPFGIARIQHVEHDVVASQSRDQAPKDEALILPSTTIGNYVVGSAPVRVLG